MLLEILMTGSLSVCGEILDCDKDDDGVTIGMSYEETRDLVDAVPERESDDDNKDPDDPDLPPVFFEYAPQPDCVGHTPGERDGNMCEQAAIACEEAEGDGPFTVIYRREMQPGEELTDDPEVVSGWELAGRTCFPHVVPPRSGAVADERITEAFARTPFATPKPAWDPPTTEVLVQWPVYFEADYGTTGFEPDEVRTVAPGEMLGRDLRIKPIFVDVLYDFGDGTTQGPTANTGGPYPDGGIQHTYTTTDQATPKITVTYTGQYSLDGGAWQPIPEYLTLTSDPTTLEPTGHHTELISP